MRRRNEPPKRRHAEAKALADPRYRRRIVPNKKRSRPQPPWWTMSMMFPGRMPRLDEESEDDEML